MPLYTTVRLDSDGKYTPVSRSIRLRSRNVIRSRASPSTRPVRADTNNWRNRGITDRAVAPRLSGACGTSRQPTTTRFSSAARSSICSVTFAASSASCGRKPIPAA
jgi:hypothetical protein